MQMLSCDSLGGFTVMSNTFIVGAVPNMTTRWYQCMYLVRSQAPAPHVGVKTQESVAGSNPWKKGTFTSSTRIFEL